MNDEIRKHNIRILTIKRQNQHPNRKDERNSNHNDGLMINDKNKMDMINLELMILQID